MEYLVHLNQKITPFIHLLKRVNTIALVPKDGVYSGIKNISFKARGFNDPHKADGILTLPTECITSGIIKDPKDRSYSELVKEFETSFIKFLSCEETDYSEVIISFQDISMYFTQNSNVDDPLTLIKAVGVDDFNNHIVLYESEKPNKYDTYSTVNHLHTSTHLVDQYIHEYLESDYKTLYYPSSPVQKLDDMVLPIIKLGSNHILARNNYPEKLSYTLTCSESEHGVLDSLELSLVGENNNLCELSKLLCNSRLPSNKVSKAKISITCIDHENSNYRCSISTVSVFDENKDGGTLATLSHRYINMYAEINTLFTLDNNNNVVSVSMDDDNVSIIGSLIDGIMRTNDLTISSHSERIIVVIVKYINDLLAEHKTDSEVIKLKKLLNRT